MNNTEYAPELIQFFEDKFPADGGFTSLSISNGLVTVSGVTMQEYEVAGFLKDLEDEKHIYNVVTSGYTKDYEKQGRVSFDVTFYVVTDQFITGDSIILIKGVRANTTYYLRELSAPKGYHLTTEDLIVIPNEEGNLLVEVPNTTGTVLPSTGGEGTIRYTITGLTLIFIAMLLLIYKKKTLDSH